MHIPSFHYTVNGVNKALLKSFEREIDSGRNDGSSILAKLLCSYIVYV